MNRAIEMAKELNQVVRGRVEYRTYQEAAYRLQQNPELFAKYNEFRRRNHDLQFREDADVLYDEVFQLVREYDTILQDSLVHEFILAEQRFCLMMQEVYNSVSDDLNLSYEYLEE